VEQEWGEINETVELIYIFPEMQTGKKIVSAGITGRRFSGLKFWNSKFERWHTLASAG
jgi:hypothetical protein